MRAENYCMCLERFYFLLYVTNISQKVHLVCLCCDVFYTFWSLLVTLQPYSLNRNAVYICLVYMAFSITSIDRASDDKTLIIENLKSGVF